MGTLFSKIYNRFLGKITDDMYIELTPEDTLKDLQNLLIDSIDGFEFPRVSLVEYEICLKIIKADEVKDDDFILGAVWGNISDSIKQSNIPTFDQFSSLPKDLKHQVQWGEIPDISDENNELKVLVDRSSFCSELSSEEINILALLMKQAWVQRQVTSIENTRMKYSGSDFKFTSQANHLSKLLNLLTESRRDSFHMQRLYKRRKIGKDGVYRSNWSILNTSNDIN